MVKAKKKPNAPEPKKQKLYGYGPVTVKPEDSAPTGGGGGGVSSSRKPIMDSQTGRLIGYEYDDGRIALKRGSISNNALDARGKPISTQSEAYKNVEVEKAAMAEVEAAQVAKTLLNTSSTALPNTLTESITRNIQDYNRPSEETNPIQRLINLPSTVNKLTAFAGKLPLGRQFINFIGQGDANTRRWLQDYSNEDNYDAVLVNLGLADDKIRAAKILALDPNLINDAKKGYEEAISQKRRALEDLKLIASKDQREYVDKVRLKMTEVQTYFDKLQVVDDLEMEAALKKGILRGVANG